MRALGHLLVGSVLVLSSPLTTRAGAPSAWGALDSGPSEVGFRLYQERDASRTVRTDSTSDGVWSRPIRVYLWYPASPGERSPMTFGEYADLATDDVWPAELVAGARTRIRMGMRPVARSLGSERWAELRSRPVSAARDAVPAQGSFPLIAVAQGLYYESPIAHAMLCELLASHGFVVVTTPLVGTNSPLVNLDVVDLETQVRDLEFAIARARELPFVSRETLGILGFDMGGMSGVMLTMRNPDVDAFASLDAGILFPHPAGLPQSSPHYDPRMLRAPWLHATQRRFGEGEAGSGSRGLFDEAVYSDRRLLLVDAMGHADFTSNALIGDRAPVITYWGPRRGDEKERYEAVCRYLLRFFKGYLHADRVSLAELSADPEKVEPELGMTLEHRPASPPQPVYSDFLNALLSGDVDRAREISRSIVNTGLPSPLLSERVVNRLGYHLVGSWQMLDEPIAVFQLNTEIHPDLANCWDSLGEGHMLKGDSEQSASCYRKVLELDPGNPRALEMLAMLGQGSPE